jgi:hypothetical protein
MTRERNQRGAALPSPIVILSVIAVAMAGIAYVATGGSEPTEREVSPVVQPQDTEAADPDAPASTGAADPKPKPKPPVRRGQTYVVVFNNSNITGLAGQVADRAADVGWRVVGSDNWYGTIPTSSVYYPKGKKRAAELLALDLGIERTAIAVDPMRRDRLTVILTGPVG